MALLLTMPYNVHPNYYQRLVMEIDKLKFNENGLIPAVIQDAISGKVLRLEYIDRETTKNAISTKKINLPFKKDKSKQDHMEITEIYYDCDEDALLLKVIPKEVSSHTETYSCFQRKFDEGSFTQSNRASIIQELYEVILERKRLNPENSYVAKKMREGVDRILKKVGEEASEVIIASKNGNKDEISWEIADLIFHILLVLAYHNMSLDEIYERLIERRK
ncbi:MAG: phosphoribosyl-ATP diphosphatase [Brevinematia bacterium]